MDINKKLKSFDEEFPCKCPVCGKSGVNPYGECKCSYKVSDKIIEKPKAIKQFLETALKEMRADTAKEFIGEIEKVQEKIHGGGNGRRLLIQLKGETNKIINE